MAKNFLDYDGLGFFTSLIKSFISKKTVNNAVTTGGTGAAYTATVDGITALAAGVSFMMIPHVTSTVVLPTLNVNGLGAKNIRRRVSNSTVTTVASGSANWLYANKPVKVTYDGTYWIADMDRPNATDIYGTLAIDNGGTGASTAEGALENLGLNKLRAGFIYPLAGETVPTGFLLCDGAEYSRTEYPELFAAIGTLYGEGDGSTTFNVPDLATRVPVGKGEGYELGDVGGEAEHTLTVDEMPGHDHLLPLYTSTGANKPGASVGYIENAGGNQWSSYGYTGGSQPHNNMQPYTVVNYIIATGKNTAVSVSDVVLGAQQIPLGVEYGGTGATGPAMARKNLEITPDNIGALSMELLWENASPTSDFAGQRINMDLTKGWGVRGIFSSSGGTLILDAKDYKKGTSNGRVQTAGATNSFRTIDVDDNGVTLGDGKSLKTYGTATIENVNSTLIPLKFYIIKGVSA